MICIGQYLYLDITIKIGYELCRESIQYGYVFTTRGVIQNGCIFRYPTHTSGHVYIGVAPLGPVGRGFMVNEG